MSTTALGWLGFNTFVALMLALDLGVFNRKHREFTFKEAMGWSAFWISLALTFNAGLYWFQGGQAASEFLAGYLIEKSLSVDNIFVIITIFAYFRIPSIYQHKILFWGIVGALLMRGAFIFAGIALIERFHAVIYVFGLLLILTAAKMAFQKPHNSDLGENRLIKFLSHRLPMTKSFADGKFLVRENGRWLATPLLLSLVVVEFTDVVFAVDSIPAILAISKNSFIVYTSNAFAILGLRSLYFVLSGAVQRFMYLHYGLAAILAFVGIKMLLADVYKVPTPWALGIVTGLLGTSIAASWLKSSSRGAEKEGTSACQ